VAGARRVPLVEPICLSVFKEATLKMLSCQVFGGSLTRCLHFTAGCTTGWVNYANESSQAALERSSQDACDVIRLTRSKAAVWTVDDVARLIEI